MTLGRVNLMRQHVVPDISVYKYLREHGFIDCLRELHLASDSMYFSEESHSLLFFFMPFSKDFQCSRLGLIQALEVWSVLSEAFGLVFLLLPWLRLYKGFGYCLGIFQGLRLEEMEREGDMFM